MGFFVGLAVVLIVAAAIGLGVEWLLTSLDLVVYVGVGFVVLHFVYSLMRDRYYDWREGPEKLEEAARQIAAKHDEREEARRRLRREHHENLSRLRALEEHIFELVYAVSERRAAS